MTFLLLLFNIYVLSFIMSPPLLYLFLLLDIVSVVKEALHVFFVCFTVTPTGSGRLMRVAALLPGPRPFTWPASSIPPHHGNVCVCS